LFSDVMGPSSTWTLFNKVLPEFASSIGEGLSVARYLAPIPWDADVVRAFVRRDLAIDMQAPNPYTLAISQIAYALFPDETGNAIEAWRGETFRRFATPTQERLTELIEAEKHLQRIRQRRSLIVATLGIFGAVLASIIPLSLVLSIDKWVYIIFPT